MIFLGLYIIRMSICVTEIEGIENNRSHNMIHDDILEFDTCYNGIFTASTSGLDTKTSVSVQEKTLFYVHILNAASHFTADCDGTMAVSHAALSDCNLLRWCLVLGTHVNLTGFNSDTVITYREIYTNDINVLTGFRIKTVCVW